MSHFLIVELSEDPINPEDRAEAGWFYDSSDINYAADYVQSLEEAGITYKDAVSRFIKEIGTAADYNKEDNSITFTHREKFFEGDFKIVKDMMEKATLQDFMDSFWAYKLKDYIRPIFGTYVYHTGECSYPLPEFLRSCKNGEKLYIGGICDYHC